LGQRGIDTQPVFARLGMALKANDQRQDYLRATLSRGADGSLVASPFPKQDSAMLSLIAKADALIIRPPNAPAAKEGDVTEILPLSGGCLGI
jgi:molybdopterin molybdotransferase